MRSLIVLAATLLFTSAAYTAEISARPQSRPWAQFSNMPYQKLVSVFVSKFREAGFKLKSKKVRDVGYLMTTLVFEYRFGAELKGRKGIAEFTIHSGDSDKEACSSCEAYLVLFGPVGNDYGPEVYERMRIELEDLRVKTLGKIAEEFREHIRYPYYPPPTCTDNCPML